MNTRYFAVFNNKGERIESYVADNMPLTVADIYQQHPNVIEVSAENWEKILLGYTRNENGTYTLNDIPLETLKEQKINLVKQLTKQKLIETDHDVLEYIENNETNSSNYALLRLERQTIRNKCEELIKKINNCSLKIELDTINIDI